MALKEILHRWDAAVKAYMAGRYEEALDIYREIDDVSARMYFNMACAHIKLDQTTEAIKCLTSAVNKDVHLAVAFFLRGVLHLKTGAFSDAKSDLHETLTLLRGNPVINYKQLGLLYKLYLCEVLYNIALVEIHEDDKPAAEDTLQQALNDADVGQRQLIQQALDLLEEGNENNIKPLFPSIENVFTPPKIVTNNLEKRKYVPKAKVVSAANVTDVEAKFDGERRVQQIRRFSELSPVIKPPKSPLLAVKNLLQKGSKSPTPGIRRNKSTGDLQAMAESFVWQTKVNEASPRRERLRSLPAESLLADSVNKENLTDHTPVKNRHRQSIGSLFGNNLTTVSQVLSSSCDVLTALVAPAFHVMDRSDSNDADSVNISETNKSNADTSVNNDQHTDSADTDISKDKCFDLSVNGTVDKIKEANVDDHITEDIENEIAKRRRPPPPSYPPPPLPSTVVIKL